jgi:hypothetical protein
MNSVYRSPFYGSYYILACSCKKICTEMSEIIFYCSGGLLTFNVSNVIELKPNIFVTLWVRLYNANCTPSIKWHLFGISRT